MEEEGKEREGKKGGIHLASVITGGCRNWINRVVKGAELSSSWREWRKEARIELQNKNVGWMKEWMYTSPGHKELARNR